MSLRIFDKKAAVQNLKRWQNVFGAPLSEVRFLFWFIIVY